MRHSAGILPDGASRPTVRRKELGSLQYMGPRAWIIHFCVADARIPRLLVSAYVESVTQGTKEEPVILRPKSYLLPYYRPSRNN